MITGIVALITLFFATTVMYSIASARRKKRQELEALRQRVIKKISYIERLRDTIAIKIPASDEVIFDHAITSYYGKLVDQGMRHYAAKQEASHQKAITAPDGMFDIDEITLPDDGQQREAALQSLYRLHQFLRSEIKAGTVPQGPAMALFRKLEICMIDGRVSELMDKGQYNLSQNVLGTARSCYENAITLMDSNTKYMDAFVEKKSLAKAQLDLIAEMLTGQTSPSPRLVIDNTQLPLPEGDGLSRMFDDEKQKTHWAN